MDEEEVEELGERVDDEITQLSVHHSRHAGEQVTHWLGRVSVVGRHEVEPEPLVVDEQLRTRRYPPASATNRPTASQLHTRHKPRQTLQRSAGIRRVRRAPACDRATRLKRGRRHTAAAWADLGACPLLIGQKSSSSGIGPQSLSKF